MSIKLLAQAWDVQLPHPEKLVLLALADNANDEGYCWPSVPNVAHKCGLEDRSVRRMVARLARRGHVTVQQRHRRTADGRVLNTSNNYLVHPRAPAAPPDPGSGPTPGPTVSTLLTQGQPLPDSRSGLP
jgi:hypothetical protein